MQPTYWQQATEEISATDPVLARIISRYPGMSMTTRGDAFYTLARSVVGQQISVKAADSVWRKFEAALPGVTPAHVAAASVETLRGCGFSARKVEYVHDLAQHFLDGRLNPEHWPQEDDETLIKELSNVRGIGRWTAEMFLMFNLLRPDVLPLDDIGLQRAVQLHYGVPELTGKPLRQHIIHLSRKWQPWRSVATWYLWRSLDPVPVEY